MIFTRFVPLIMDFSYLKWLISDVNDGMFVHTTLEMSNWITINIPFENNKHNNNNVF